MWLFLIRPQKRRQVEQARMQDELEPGTEILTAGGIHGTVQRVEGELVELEIAPGTVIRLDRRAVAAVTSEPAGVPEDDLEAPHPEQAAPDDAS